MNTLKNKLDVKTGIEIFALGNPEFMTKAYTQQGDCLVKKVGVLGVFAKEFAEIPKDAKKLNTNLVLKGQQNNHAIYFGDFEVLEHEGTTFLRVFEPCILDHVRDLNTQSHAEHHAIWIARGEYFIDQVNEYDHVREEKRKIID